MEIQEQSTALLDVQWKEGSRRFLLVVQLPPSHLLSVFGPSIQPKPKPTATSLRQLKFGHQLKLISMCVCVLTITVTLKIIVSCPVRILNRRQQILSLF